MFSRCTCTISLLAPCFAVWAPICNIQSAHLGLQRALSMRPHGRLIINEDFSSSRLLGCEKQMPLSQCKIEFSLKARAGPEVKKKTPIVDREFWQTCPPSNGHSVNSKKFFLSRKIQRYQYSDSQPVKRLSIVHPTQFAKMNIFRLAGDMTHLLSIIVLLLKIRATRSCRGMF